MSDLARWRAYGLALLPLALSGLLPPAVVALLCGVTALGVWRAEWVQARLLLGVLVVAGGAALAAPGVLAGPPAGVATLAASTLLGLLAVTLLHLGTTRIEAGHRAGLLLPLGLGLLAPQPLLLLALAGGALARPAEDDRAAAWYVAPGPAAWRWPVTAVLAAVVFGLLLPRGPSVWATLVQPATATLASRAAPDLPDPPAPEPDGPNTTLRRGVNGPPIVITLGRPILPLELILVAGVLLGIAILWRSQPRAGGVTTTWVERLMAVGLIVGGVVGLVSALALSRTSGTAGSGPAPPQGDSVGGMMSRVPSFDAPARTVDFSALVNVMVGVSVLLIAGLTLAAFLARRDDPDPEQLDLPTGPDGLPLPPGVPAPPLHRVRRAWRAAEAALEATGRPRLPAESPLAYADRLGRDVPLLRGPLAALARVYGPVRYGAQVTESGAGTAERALTEVRVIIPTLPPPRPADPRGTP